MNKLISAVLSVIMAISALSAASVTANAAESRTFEAIGDEVQVSENTVLKYAYNIPTDYVYKVRFKDTDTLESLDITFDDCTSSAATVTGLDGVYTRLLQARYSGSGNAYSTYSFSETDGKYVKVKIKLSDFSSYFNEDGTVDIKDHNYNFGADEDGYYSGLVIASGAAYTAVTPDEKGEAEFYISAQIGTITWFLTHFNVGNGTIDKLDIKMGDVNDDFSVDITDVTDVMKNIAGIDKFDSLQRFLSDVNLDGIADVKDATEIQRWICR